MPESASESESLSEMLLLQCFDGISIPVTFTNDETESIRALFFIADYTGRGASPVFKTAGYFPEHVRAMRVPSQLSKMSLRDGTRKHAGSKCSVPNDGNGPLGRNSGSMQGVNVPS